VRPSEASGIADREDIALSVGSFMAKRPAGAHHALPGFAVIPLMSP
jgi:hypothetical protein